MRQFLGRTAIPITMHSARDPFTRVTEIIPPASFPGAWERGAGAKRQIVKILYEQSTISHLPYHRAGLDRLNELAPVPSRSRIFRPTKRTFKLTHTYVGMHTSAAKQYPECVSYPAILRLIRVLLAGLCLCLSPRLAEPLVVSI